MSQAKRKDFNYQSKNIPDKPHITKKMRNLLIAVASVAVVMIVVLLCVENNMKNKIVVKNKSSHNITSMKFWYEDENGGITDVMDLGALKAKEKVSKSTESLALSELIVEDACLSVYIIFEDGGKALVQTGHFLYDFDGKISLVISDTEDEELMLHLKAGEGLFNSSSTTGCDDIYYVNPKDGYIE